MSERDSFGNFIDRYREDDNPAYQAALNPLRARALRDVDPMKPESVFFAGETESRKALGGGERHCIPAGTIILSLEDAAEVLRHCIGQTINFIHRDISPIKAEIRIYRLKGLYNVAPGRLTSTVPVLITTRGGRFLPAMRYQPIPNEDWGTMENVS